MDLLQAAGVPAGMVQRSIDHQEDPHLDDEEIARVAASGALG